MVPEEHTRHVPRSVYPACTKECIPGMYPEVYTRHVPRGVYPEVYIGWYNPEVYIGWYNRYIASLYTVVGIPPCIYMPPYTSLGIPHRLVHCWSLYYTPGSMTAVSGNEAWAQKERNPWVGEA